MDLKQVQAGDIMSTDLTTVSQEEKLSAAEVLMIKKNVGGLPVVTKNNELIGIITQRDIQLSHTIIGSTAFHVSDLMSKNPIYCYIDTKLPEIVSKMLKYDIERIPVIENENRVVGIIVTRDIITTLGMALEDGDEN